MEQHVTGRFTLREELRMENMLRHKLSLADIARVLHRSYMSVYYKAHPEKKYFNVQYFTQCK